MNKLARMFVAFGVLIVCACGSEKDDMQTIECISVGDDFTTDSGWGASDLCDDSQIGACYPFFGNNTESCEPFVSMRTDASDDASIDSCKLVMETLNCNTYVGDTGDVTFHVETEDRLTMRMLGTLNGRAFDTILHLNPCQPGCLAGISLDTLDDDQQKICEIPRQGFTTCLFPETAHNVTFREVNRDRLNLVLAGTENLLTAETVEE